MPPLQLTSHNVAVIGGGAAGLVAARELRREGHKVVVFEQQPQLGGTWVYNPQVESDPIGLDPNRKVIVSSLYQSLRTNLPREVMGFRDFPFVATEGPGRDSCRFPRHEEVLRYLEDFACNFKLNELVRYRTEVKHVGLENGKLKVRSTTQGENGSEADEIFDAVVVCNGHYTHPQIADIPGDPGRDSRRYPCHEEVLRYLDDFAHEFNLDELVRYETEVKHVELENGKFKVRSIRRGGEGREVDETFDAVIVCNGQYAQPRIALVPGIEKWPGKQIHSHNYRVPQPYENLVVAIIGGGSSAEDISRELARVAKEVHVASRSPSIKAFGKQPGFDNMWLHPMITSANEDGSVTFEDGNTIFANVILHCTGYKYAFPFLDSIDAVTVDDNRVGPLYKHVFPPALAPRLSFVGIQWRIVPFPLFELQSKWIAGVLSGRIPLPSTAKMMEDVQAFYSKLEDAGVPKRYTHMLGEVLFEYLDWLATQCGCAPVEEWRKLMTQSSLKMRIDRLDSYRDEWDEGDDVLLLEAQKDFAKYRTDTEDAEFGAQTQSNGRHAVY